MLSVDEAEIFVKASESIGFQHQGSRGAAYGEAFRDNDRIQVDDPALADQLWRATGLRDLMSGISVEEIGAPVGLNPNIRIYRYSKGQRFGRHVDDANVVDRPTGLTCYTLLIYLTEAGGGETVFYDHKGRKVASVAPKPGRALLHRHGDECLEHEGMAVTAGQKYVLRSDVVYAIR